MPTKPKLLIAGGGYADIPMILAGKALGYHVISSGNRASDLGHQHADETHLEDFSNQEAMLTLARKLGIQAVCAACNDFSALSAAYIAEQMGLPGHDPLTTAKTIHHKDTYRQFAAQNGIPTPKALTFSNIDDALAAVNQLSFPIMVKPVDLTGGKGMSKITGQQALKPALEQAFSASKAKRMVLEEFIEGTRHGCSAMLKDGKIVFTFIDDEHYFVNQYLVSGASTTSLENLQPIREQLILASEKIARLLHLKDGIFHIQFILNQGVVYIIEICRRPPGDLYVKLVEYATRAPYPEWIVRVACGLDFDSNTVIYHPYRYITRHCIMGNQTGLLKTVQLGKLQAKIFSQTMLWQENDPIDNYLTYKAGIVFLQHESRQSMLEAQSVITEEIRMIYI